MDAHYHSDTLFLDFETSSDVPLDVCGVGPYIASALFEPICACCARGGGAVESWTYESDTPLADWLEARKPKVLVAHNLEFELEVLHRIGLGHWERDCGLFDTACAARRMDTGARLGEVCKVWKTTEKSESGSGLIKKWLCGMKVIPDDALAEIVLYCEQDVRCLREIWSWLVRYPMFDEAEFRAHRAINMRGFCVDPDIVEFIATESAVALDALRSMWRDRACAITAEGKGNPKSVVCRRALARALGGTGTESWRRGTTDFEGAPEQLQLVVAEYQDLADSAFKKTDSIRSRVSADKRLRGAFMYSGQRTGRFASKGAQLHNLPRTVHTYDEIGDFLTAATEGTIAQWQRRSGVPTRGRPYLDLLKSAIRGIFIAPKGRALVVGDFSQIELRLQALMTGEQWMLDIFRDGGDLYVEAAARMLGIQPDQVSADQRQLGKIATLALGYGSGPVGLARAGYPMPKDPSRLVQRDGVLQAEEDGFVVPEDFELAQDGILLPIERLVIVVRAWRANRPHTTRAWRNLDHAATRCIETGMPESLELSTQCRVAMSTEKTPAGRILHVVFECAGERIHLTWCGCRVTQEEGDHGTQRRMTYRKGLTTGIAFWGGTIFENFAQSLAARCLHRAIARCEAQGLEVVAHVHDELVVECDAHKAQEVTDALTSAMRLPNFGGLLKADVWDGVRYGKN